MGGGITFIIGTLLWIILFSIFTIISGGLYMGLMGTSTFIGLGSIIIGFVLNEEERKKGLVREKKYPIISVIFIVLGIYICLGLLLVDSPFGPPILGTSTMNVDIDINFFNVGFLAFMFGSVFIVILSGLVLLFSNSKVWVIIGLVGLAIAMVIFLAWFDFIITGYIFMMGGPPPLPSI